MAKRTEANRAPLHEYVTRYPDETCGPYVVRMWFDEINGRVELVGVEFWGRLPWVPLPEQAQEWAQQQAEAVRGGDPLDGSPRPVNAVAIRNVPFMSLAADARKDVAAALLAKAKAPGPMDILTEKLRADQGEIEGLGLDDLWQLAVLAAESERKGLLAAAEAVQGKVAAGRGRPTKYGPDFYAEVAQVYRTAERAGVPNPTLTVAEHIGAQQRRAVTKSAAAKWVAICRRSNASGDPVDPGDPGALLPPWEPKAGRTSR